jgi:hypothetical protein
MNTPKLCIDCKHYKSRNCYSPENGVDLVDGGLKAEMCVVMRSEAGKCKPSALLFEAAEPVVYDLAALFPDVNFPNLIRTTNE